MSDWEGTFRVETITKAKPDWRGWVAFDLTLRPMDKRGRTNGRTQNLTTLKVGGPRGSVDMTGLRPGIKAFFRWVDGPAPTIRATFHPVTS